MDTEERGAGGHENQDAAGDGPARPAPDRVRAAHILRDAGCWLPWKLASRVTEMRHSRGWTPMQSLAGNRVALTQLLRDAGAAAAFETGELSRGYEDEESQVDLTVVCRAAAGPEDEPCPALDIDEDIEDILEYDVMVHNLPPETAVDPLHTPDGILVFDDRVFPAPEQNLRPRNFAATVHERCSAAWNPGLTAGSTLIAETPEGLLDGLFADGFKLEGAEPDEYDEILDRRLAEAVADAQRRAVEIWCRSPYRNARYRDLPQWARSALERPTGARPELHGDGWLPEHAAPWLVLTAEHWEMLADQGFAFPNTLCLSADTCADLLRGLESVLVLAEWEMV